MTEQRSSSATEQDYLEDNIATVAFHLGRPGARLSVANDISESGLVVYPGAVLKEVSRRLTVPAQPSRDAQEADRYFDMAGEFGHQLQKLAGVVQDAIDILAERKQGSPARSAGHNARVILETAMKSVPASALPSTDGPTPPESPHGR